MCNIIRQFYLGIIVLGILGGTMANGNSLSKDGKLIIPGSYLQAWYICYSAFKQIDDLADEEKKLEHYEVEFSEDENNYIIEFIPKLLSEDKAKILNKMVIGRNTKYWVSKKNFRIIKRVFFKA